MSDFKTRSEKEISKTRKTLSFFVWLGASLF